MEPSPCKMQDKAVTIDPLWSDPFLILHAGDFVHWVVFFSLIPYQLLFVKKWIFLDCLCRKLNQLAPLESFRHVKRVRKKIIEGMANYRLFYACVINQLVHLEYAITQIYLISPWICWVIQDTYNVCFWPYGGSLIW